MEISKLPVLFLLGWIAFSQTNWQSNFFPFSTSKEMALHTVSAEENTAAGDPALRQRISDYLRSKGVNGNVAVVKGDQVLFNEGIGFANTTNKSLNQRLTTHPIGSITKAIVATSVLQLQEKGKLSIHDPVAKYYPHFPNGANIQLIHLLNHTSGIQAPYRKLGNRSPDEVIRAIEKKPAKFSPGSRWDYKDVNYVVLGNIIEKVAGIPLHEYIQKNIFAKAGMVHSGFMTESDFSAHSSTGYVKKMNTMIASRPLHPESLFGFADIYSTASDICRFDQALMNDRLITNQSVATMLKPGSSSGYGLGLYNLGYAVYSRGIIGGWESLHVYYKDTTSIALLLNVRDKSLDIHQVSKDLFKIIATQTRSPLSTDGELSRLADNRIL